MFNASLHTTSSIQKHATRGDSTQTLEKRLKGFFIGFVPMDLKLYNINSNLNDAELF